MQPRRDLRLDGDPVSLAVIASNQGGFLLARIAMAEMFTSFVYTTVVLSSIEEVSPCAT